MADKWKNANSIEIKRVDVLIENVVKAEKGTEGNIIVSTESGITYVVTPTYTAIVTPKEPK